MRFVNPWSGSLLVQPTSSSDVHVDNAKRLTADVYAEIHDLWADLDGHHLEPSQRCVEPRNEEEVRASVFRAILALRAIEGELAQANSAIEKEKATR